MSTKSTILYTNDANEHWFNDCGEPLTSLKDDSYKDAITLEFSKQNIRVDMDDKDSLAITITNPDSELYKIFAELAKQLRGY